MWTSYVGVVVVAAVMAGSISGGSLAEGASGRRAAVAFLVLWAALAGTLAGVLAVKRQHDQQRR